MAIEITGKIISVLPLQTGEGKNGQWKKQEFLIETQDQYPKKVLFNIWGDKVSLGSFNVGSDVTVSFNPESREFNGKYYTDLRAWRIVAAGAVSNNNSSNNNNYSNNNSGNYNNAPAAVTATDDFPMSASVKDDLPF